MSRHVVSLTVIGLFAAAPAAAQSQAYAPQVSAPRVYATQVETPANFRYAAAPRQMGGGFLEFLFNNTGEAPRARRAVPADPFVRDPYVNRGYDPEPARPAMDPRYLPQTVAFDGKHAPGTIVIDTPNRFLYLVEEGGKARRYGIGVGRPGFTWAGVKSITRKAEWPDWVPPPEMLQRRPDLPRHMAGGPDNPLGARAMYLGSSLYRIHGSNEPWTIGTAVSSGCIRMRNEDVIDLYGRVKVGTRVVVI